MTHRQEYEAMMSQHAEAIRLAEERGRKKMRRQITWLVVLGIISYLAWSNREAILSYEPSSGIPSIVIEEISTPIYTPLNQSTPVPTLTHSGTMDSTTDTSGKVKPTPNIEAVTDGLQGGLPTDPSKDK